MAMLETRSLPFRQGDLTFEDFLFLVPEDQKADLLDGVIYMASPDTFPCNDLMGWLLSVLGAYADELKLGAVYASCIVFRISEKHSPEPDIAFLATEHGDRMQRDFVAGPPDLAIEIVSPDSVHRDYILEREVYEQAGVPEYLILDPDEKRATFLRLNNKGKYEEVKPVNRRIHSTVVKGLWLDVRWLFRESRPTSPAVIKQLLAESGQ